MNDLAVVDKGAGWRRLKALVLDSVSSPITKRVYNLFFAWYGRVPRAYVQAHPAAGWSLVHHGSGREARSRTNGADADVGEGSDRDCRRDCSRPGIPQRQPRRRSSRDSPEREGDLATHQALCRRCRRARNRAPRLPTLCRMPDYAESHHVSSEDQLV